MALKVLFVEDDSRYLDYYRRSMSSRGVEVLQARGTSLASALLERNPDIVAVVVDGKLLDTTCIEETCDFVKRVRATGFSGHLVAASSNEMWRAKLERAGCNHDGGSKEHVPEKLAEILGL